MSCQPLRGGNSIITRGCVPRAVPTPTETEPFTSDAILKPEIVYIDGMGGGTLPEVGEDVYTDFFDIPDAEVTAAQAEATRSILGRETYGGGSTARLQSGYHVAMRPVGDPINSIVVYDTRNAWSYVDSGGPAGRGFLLSRADDDSIINGQWTAYAFEAASRGAGAVSLMNLRAQELPSEGIYVLGFCAIVGVNVFGIQNSPYQPAVLAHGLYDIIYDVTPFLAVVINQDRTVSIRKLAITGTPGGDTLETMRGDGTWTTIETSTLTVPSAAWFSIEAGTYVSRRHFSSGQIATPTGLYYVRLYTAATGPLGVSLMNEQRVSTREGLVGDTVAGMAWGTDVRGLIGDGAGNSGNGLAGIGFGGVVVYRHEGAVKRYLYDTRVGTSFATNPTLGRALAARADLSTGAVLGTARYSVESVRDDAREVLAVSPFIAGRPTTFGLTGINNVLLKSGSEELVFPRQFGDGPNTDVDETSFSNFPNGDLITETDPATSEPFDPSAVSAAEVGHQQDDVEVKVQQIGLEYAFRTIVVNEEERGPLAPVANFAILNDALDGRTYSFHSTSVDWDGTIVSYLWDFGDGNTSTDETPFHVYEKPGNFLISLTVTDNDGLTDTATTGVTIANRPPSANFDYEANPDDVTFQTIDFTDLSVEVDEDDSLTWLWDFGDGDTSTEQNPTHEYAAPGTYTVTLTVTDLHGASDDVSQDIDLPLTPPVGDCELSPDALADLAFVQGDDFDGGNPPFPAYADRDAFKVYYWDQSVFREWYDTPFATIDDTTAFDLDATTLFHGHKTLKMGFGKPAATSYYGAGWSSVPTDDGDPTEVYYTNSPHNGPLTLWHRQIFKAEAGVMSDGSLVATSRFQGLCIAQLITKFSEYKFGVFARNGRLYLDQQSVEVLNGVTFVSTDIDLGPETSFIGRGDALFGELIFLFEADPTNHQVRLRIWIGDACGLGGVSPISDTTKPVFRSGGGAERVGVGNVDHYGANGFFTPSGAIKSLWHALGEMEPDTVNANPYGVALT